MVKKIGICGHFGINQNLKNGQTVKTINIYNELCNEYGKENIDILDTYAWKKNPIMFILKSIRLMKASENLIILPAQNGVKIFIPFFAKLKKIYKTNLIYIVVGGWLPEFIANKKVLKRNMKKFDAVLVETRKMKENLEELGFNNIDILLNFKTNNAIRNVDINKINNKPLKVCTFSRVIPEKGIENAINAVTNTNEEAGDVIYLLDIYGPISDEYKERFNEVLKKSNEKYISYKGIVHPEKSVDTIEKYDMLLFPTYYNGEGLAGTIIDAFSAGVPVAASDWRYNTDIIADGITGFIFETKNDKQLEAILKKFYLREYDILKMKENCLIEAKKYNSKVAIKKLIEHIV